MNQMMKQCCGSDGRPDFDMMKRFMTNCGKSDFSEKDLETMKQFCFGEGMPDMSRMKEMMEMCGCHVPESAEEEK